MANLRRLKTGTRTLSPCFGYGESEGKSLPSSAAVGGLPVKVVAVNGLEAVIELPLGLRAFVRLNDLEPDEESQAAIQKAWEVLDREPEKFRAELVSLETDTSTEEIRRLSEEIIGAASSSTERVQQLLDKG